MSIKNWLYGIVDCDREESKLACIIGRVFIFSWPAFFTVLFWTWVLTIPRVLPKESMNSVFMWGLVAMALSTFPFTLRSVFLSVLDGLLQKPESSKTSA